MSKDKILLWEWPIRLFHWLLVITILALFITVKNDMMFLHGKLGIFVLGLLTFRITLGIIGGDVMRFRYFVKGPSTIRQYWRGAWKGYGHNPLGAWSVVLLLGITAIQAITGLFVNDDVAFNGPLYHWVSHTASNRFTHIHHFTSNLLLASIILHIAAILFYTVIKKQSLVKPMIQGYQTTEALTSPKPQLSRPWAIVVALLLGIFVIILGNW